MWVIALFDLPTDTPDARRAYAQFRKRLVQDGFTMLQFSVYGRHCPSEENAAAHSARIEGFLPPDGEVRVLVLTDKQFERMRIFHGRIRSATESPPEQITFF